VCDHYVINKCKSEFLYMVQGKDVKCYSLSHLFMHDKVFPMYPKIYETLQAESAAMYKKDIYLPVIEKRKTEITKINKKSVYRHIQLDDMDNKENQEDDAAG